MGRTAATMGRTAATATMLLATVAALLAWAPGVRGQGPGVDYDDGAGSPGPALRSIPAAAAGSGIHVDGRLDEPGWARGTPATGFVQQDPDEGRPASQPTEVRVLLDGESLWVGARMTDSAPDSIVARLARRDESVVSDWFYVYLDSYHDRRSAFGFGVNPAGVERDLRISEDVRRDPSWDAVWDAAVAVDSAGWSAELRIPLSQLRFSSGEGEEGRPWGVNFVRVLSRRNETSYWAPVPRDANGFVSHFGELTGLGELQGPRRLELIPYAVGRLTRAPGNPENPFYRETDPFASVGADMRMGLTPGLTLSATFNPDFGQVEADPSTINLSAFEIFQQERRPFFVEGQEIFTPVHPMWPPTFYSRRIGRRPQGGLPGGAVWSDAPDATTILGAAKISGKTADGWSVGLLDAVTAEESAPFVDGSDGRGSAVVEPRTNYAVARVAREFNGGSSTLGVLATATNRDLAGADLDFLHDQAYAAGVDGFHRFGGGEYELAFNLTGSHVRGSKEAIARTQRAPGRYLDRPDADHLELDPDRTSLTGARAGLQLRKSRGSWRFWTNANAWSPGFEINDLGFNQNTDKIVVHGQAGYYDFTPGSLFRTWNLGAAQGRSVTFGGERRDHFFELMGGFQLLSYWGGGFWTQRHLSGSLDPDALRGGPALRTPGYTAGGLWLNSDRRKAVSANAFAYWKVEDEAGGYTTNGNLNLGLKASDRLTLEVGPSLSKSVNPRQYLARTDGPEGPLHLAARVEQTTLSLSTRLSYTFTPDLTLQLWARPFLASGRFSRPREVADPRARTFDERFRTYQEGEELEVMEGEDGERTFLVDRDRDGQQDLTLTAPDFNSRSLQLNAVARWEWRPGSTLFAVWSHHRSASGPGPFELRRDLGELWDAPGRNVFLVKMSYWLGG